jgi:hypothetical protein
MYLKSDCAPTHAAAGCWRDLRYQGDWMLRPIASNEVAPLVRLLVGVSRAVNSSLGLTGVPTPPGEEPPETVTQVRLLLLLMVCRRGGKHTQRASTYSANTSLSLPAALEEPLTKAGRQVRWLQLRCGEGSFQGDDTLLANSNIPAGAEACMHRCSDSDANLNCLLLFLLLLLLPLL